MGINKLPQFGDVGAGHYSAATTDGRKKIVAQQSSNLRYNDD